MLGLAICYLLLAGIYSAAAWCADNEPQTMAGYSTMSPERRRQVDIEALGHCAARWLRRAAALSLAGIATLFFPWAERAAIGAVALPAALVAAGWILAWRKYGGKTPDTPPRQER